MSDAPGAVLRGAVDLSALRERANRPQATDGAADPGAPSPVMDITEADFQPVIELSQRVPVLVELYDPRSGTNDALATLVTQLAGRLVLARADVQANPSIAQAFRAQQVPMGVAILAGQPVPVFVGPADEAQLRELLGRLLELAAQQGLTGSIPVADGSGSEEPAEPELPPLHAAAYAAIEAGEYDTAIAAYEQALTENPRDDQARAGLGQVRLLARVQGLDLQTVRDAAAAAPHDVPAQFAVADMDLAGGHVDDAFGRLLDLFAALPADQRGPVRERLLELFGLVGDADPRVLRARGRLSSLLF